MTIIESGRPADNTETSSPLRARLPFIVCVLLACVMMFANYVVVIPLQLIPGTAELSQRSLPFGTAWNVLLCVVAFMTALGLVWLASKHVLGATLRRIGWVFTKDSGFMFLIGWAVVGFTMLFTQLITPLIGFNERTPIPPEAWEQLTVGTVTATIIMKVFQGLILQGIPEELVWRGWLMHCLDQRPRLALAVSATVFGAMHIVSSGGQENLLERIVYLFQAGAFAFVGGALALRLRSLWAAIGVHAGMHFTFLIFNFTPLNGAGVAVWLIETFIWTALGLLILRGWKGTKVEFVR